MVNKKCAACGCGYEYCPDCSRTDKLAPTWKATFCSETCKELWRALTQYNMNRLTKEEAKETISALKLKSIDSYVKCVQRDYAKVMIEEKKPRRAKKTIEPEIIPVVEEPVAKSVTVDDPIENTHHEVVEANE